MIKDYDKKIIKNLGDKLFGEFLQNKELSKNINISITALHVQKNTTIPIIYKKLHLTQDKSDTSAMKISFID